MPEGIQDFLKSDLFKYTVVGGVLVVLLKFAAKFLFPPKQAAALIRVRCTACGWTGTVGKYNRKCSSCGAAITPPGSKRNSQ